MRKTDVTYANDGGVTPALHFTYDADGRTVATSTSTLGTQTYQYDAIGGIVSIGEPASLGSATIGFSYYADGLRSALSFSSATYSAAPLYQYKYRPDGLRSSLVLNNGTSFSWTYTSGKRSLTQSDPLTGATIAPSANYTIGQSGTLHPVYPASMTYLPRTISYDSYGRAIGVQLPEAAFTYSNITYDLEDGIAGQKTTAVQMPATTTNLDCVTTSIRNELVSSNICPSSTTPMQPSPIELDGKQFGFLPTIDGTGNSTSRNYPLDD